MKSIPMMNDLLFLTSLAFLAIAAQARTLSSEGWHDKIVLIIGHGRALNPPPPPPNSAPATKQITNIINYLKKFTPQLSSQSSPPADELTTKFERTKRTPPPSPKLSPSKSHLQTKTSTSTPSVTGKAKQLSPPPPPAPSKSPEQSENIASPCVAENSCWMFIRTKTDYGRPKLSPPPPPSPSKSPTHSENIASPCAADNSCSGVITIVADYGKTKTLHPPPPAPSKSATQSENNGSNCITRNSCSSRSFIKMVNDHNYGRTKKSPPPSPKPAPPQHYELTRVDETLNYFLSLFI